jgi:Fe-Mn family superoxide dismutase
MKEKLFLPTRREALGTMIGAGLGVWLAPFGAVAAQTTAPVKVNFDKLAPGAAAMYPFALPDLPYAFNALAAAIDEQTMQIHHGRHHKAYTDNLNNALKDHPDWQKKSIVELLSNLQAVPAEVRNAVRNHGGGYFNHALFWRMMSPNGGGMPAGDLAAAITRDFGSFDAFKEKFNKAATTLFGSGWAWLVRTAEGKLDVVQTPNQDTPLASGQKPVLGIDVWEHAYYLRYQNKRAEYATNFWNVINWEQCAKNFAA